MGSTIHARSLQTVDRMAEGLRVSAGLRRDRVGPTILAFGQVAALASLGFSVFAVEEQGWSMLPIVALALLLTAGFAIANFFVYSDRSRVVVARFVLQRMPEGSRDVEWTFSDDGIARRTDVAALSSSWELVTKVVEVPSGFLIYRGKYEYDWIPGEAFGSPVAARLFAGLAASRAKEYVLIGECRTTDDFSREDDRRG